MPQQFNLLASIPLIFLAIVFAALFAFFLWGAIILLRAEGIPENIQKGRRILILSFYGLLSALLVALVFYSVNYFLKRSQMPKPGGPTAEFPLSPADGFPEAPQSIQIAGFYFRGPWPLKDFNMIGRDAVFSILCKKGDNYDIIFINRIGKGNLLKNKQYGCWLEQCGGSIKNLFTAVFWINSKAYGGNQASDVQRKILEQVTPPCSSGS